MTDAIRKRREARARYYAALATWHAADAPKPCPGCHDTGYILHENGALPCPMCRPDEAREASAIYDPDEVTP